MLDNYEHWSVDIVGLLTVKGLEKYLEPQVPDALTFKTEAMPAPPTEETEQTTQTQTPKETAKDRQDNAACLALIRRHATGKVKIQLQPHLESSKRLWSFAVTFS